jgi:tRNA dimethylallyltransferase
VDNCQDQKRLISIVGPTGIGKTALAIKVAKHFNTEIISADSRQFYKEMHIGTAVPSPEELSAVPHHFIQHRSIFQNYSVGDFERDAIALLHELFKKYDVVVMVGGSGLYIDAVIKGLDEFPSVKPEIREGLNRTLVSQGIEVLQNQLKQVDPVYYAEVDIHNSHRLIRALEICIGTGKPYSSYLNQKSGERFFKNYILGIDAERKVIYDRINERVELMMKQGLLKEAKDLFEQKRLNALQTVGYTELFRYLDTAWSLDFAVSEIKKNTRRFAKRQLTWFKKRAEIIWVDYKEDIRGIMNKINNFRSDKF